MTEPVIRVENLSKKYILRHQAGATRADNSIRDSLTKGTQGLVRRFLRRSAAATPATQEEFWALRDISFEVQRGEVVGIIGRNGAGKSTLLKILSRITEPTSGRLTLKGRVASLLEVGTGFHPELTGRENVYLNGAILGMSRAEIKRKFDEIVAFAEVEKFLDTQVKHYSSGMYMRLAFAVAAHLDPEILIVDEVLAVGDAEFQKKCLGKMGEVAGQGRTVLFVSHNMQAVSQLTGRVIILKKGLLDFQGDTSSGIEAYAGAVFEEGALGKPFSAPASSTVAQLTYARVRTSEADGHHRWGEPIDFEFELTLPQLISTACFSFQVLDDLDRPVAYFWLFNRCEELAQGPGVYKFACHISKFRLYMGRYTLKTWLSDRRAGILIEVLSRICPFEVTMQGVHREQYDWQPSTTVYLEDNSWSFEGKVSG